MHAAAPALAGGAAADRLSRAGRAVPAAAAGGDPSRIPSALIGRPAPQTALPALEGLLSNGAPVPGLDPARLQGQGQRRQCLGVLVRAVPR